MSHNFLSSSVGLFLSAASLLAQTNLNNFPSRNVGWPLLTVSNANPNLVEGRELDGPQAAALDNSVSPAILYVSDFQNSRVLAWKNSTTASYGQVADLV